MRPRQRHNLSAARRFNAIQLGIDRLSMALIVGHPLDSRFIIKQFRPSQTNARAEVCSNTFLVVTYCVERQETSSVQADPPTEHYNSPGPLSGRLISQDQPWLDNDFL
eukprot:4845317-Amphidinium_carterae.1